MSTLNEPVRVHIYGHRIDNDHYELLISYPDTINGTVMIKIIGYYTIYGFDSAEYYHYLNQTLEVKHNGLKVIIPTNTRHNHEFKLTLQNDSCYFKIYYYEYPIPEKEPLTNYSELVWYNLIVLVISASIILGFILASKRKKQSKYDEKEEILEQDVDSTVIVSQTNEKIKRISKKNIAKLLSC